MTSPDGSLGVGLIGTGYMGKCHALAWNAVRAVFGDVARPRLEMLAEVSEDLARQRASAFGFARATSDWRALVNDPAVDVVSITTPNAFHPEMAITALQAGKHVWCEKPMAPALADAQGMLAAARASGRIAALGYNYIQNPAFREIARMIADGAIGEPIQFRAEMDEDFMADPEQAFYWKSEASSGYGALDDFAVHPLSLAHRLFGKAERVFCDMAKPYATRPLAEGGRRAVETHDMANVLLRFPGGLQASLLVNRSAWGRKGRIALQVFGSKGSILYDQERMNEIELYSATGDPARQGFTRILAGPAHPPYGSFVPAPGHGLGFNDLKVIECRELIRLIKGEPASLITFEEGIEIERTVHAAARSFASGGWEEVG
ncbi:Gfo/Idh/MocA family protein [Stappia indica]|uniref:Gfo/Idh/MocA family oxidoreductase n=1 Tax=Stappia indica TaxID=538381 RepID=A0A857CD77_9HYPH|nr:Gfo/Idh/MocA family oxidoreductase [Stappia indica]QGZ37033.1 gfo/Idh/MocA family oxidoreductase [Stappia indica]